MEKKLQTELIENVQPDESPIEITAEELLGISELDRRSFLWMGLAGIAGLCLPELAEAGMKPLQRRKIANLSQIAPVGSMISGQGFRKPGYVVEVEHASVFPKGTFKPNQNKVSKMVHALITRLVGLPNSKQAWSKFVGPGDKVGILIDAAGNTRTRTRREVLLAVIAGVHSTGVPLKDIIIWAENAVALPHLGFALNRSAGKMKVTGSNISGFDKRYRFGGGGGLFGGGGHYISNIVSRQCTHIINIATLEDDLILGCRLSLAQQALSSFSNPVALARKWGGAQGIGDIASFNIMKQKFILHIIDGLAGAYAGNSVPWHPQLLLGSTDPVALDRVAFGKIEAARRRRGLNQISGTRRSPRHINTAAIRGAGVANLSNIRYKRVSLK